MAQKPQVFTRLPSPDPAVSDIYDKLSAALPKLNSLPATSISATIPYAKPGSGQGKLVFTNGLLTSYT